nr:alpha/beta fold hydrolase [Acuticoccus kalidii]
MWRDQIEALDGVDPVVADITRGKTLRELAEAVLDAGGDRFALAGFSLGGIVAQEVMRLQPERVSHLALIDTTMRPDTPERAKDRAALVSLAERSGRFHGFGEALLSTYFAPTHVGNAAMADRVRGMTARLGADVFVRQSRIERPHGEATLAKIEIPTLVMCGAHDRLTPPEIHREMARLIPNARLLIVKDAGHMTPIEAPEIVSGALKRLLKRRV